MANKLKITFVDIPVVNDTIGFYFTTLSTPFLRSSTFKTTRVNPSEVTIGTTINETATNYYNALVLDYGDDFTFTLDANIIYIEANNLSNIFDAYINYDESIFATFQYITIPTTNILSRSPYNISINPLVSFDEAFLNLKVYRGEQTTDAPSTTTFALSKSVVQAGQPKIRFEVSKYINDYVKNNIYAFGSTGVHTSSTFDSVWIDAEIIAYYLGSEVGSEQRQYYAVDGFGWHTELFNPAINTKVLSSVNKHIFYLGSDYPIYFFSSGLQGIYVNENPVSFTLDETINNQAIAFLNVGAYAIGTGNIQVIFDYGDTYEEHNFMVLSECRYPLYNCFFKNKFGFWQSIPFNLRSKETIETESNEYMPVVSFYGEYSLLSHNTKTFQPTAKTTITCNTDYLPEHYNILFKELMLSEFVYLEHNGTYLPVNLNKKTIDVKTKKFDKLIQYTIDFKYSFNEMNTVI